MEIIVGAYTDLDESFFEVGFNVPPQRYFLRLSHFPRIFDAFAALLHVLQIPRSFHPSPSPPTSSTL